MRIAVDGRYMQDHYPGVGRYAYSLAQALAVAAPSDHLVVLYDPGAPSTRFDLARLADCANVTLLSAPYGPMGLRQHLAVGRLVRREGCSVFLAPHWRAPWGLPCPLVVTIHDLTPWVLREGGGPSWRRWLYRCMVRGVLRRAAEVIVSSRATERDLGWLIERTPPTTVAPLGVDAAFHARDAAAWGPVLARLGARRPYVLCVSSNRPHKNLGRLIRAWASLPADRRAAWQLVLAGPVDPRWEDPQELARGLGIEACVQRLGAVSDPDLATLYAGADLCVVPSLYEGFGLPALEAMASGVAVAASDRAALPEVVADAGALFDPTAEEAMGGALATLMDDAALRERLGAAGRQRAAAYTWGRTAALVREVLERAARGAR